MKQDMPTPTCYAGAEARLNRWFEKFQRDRDKHEKARRSHPDPATLDADFSRVVRAAGLTRHDLHLTELRVATAMLHAGARATKEHFQDFESNNLGGIKRHLEAHSVPWASAVAPELAAFLEAITSSGSEAVLTNIGYFYVVNSGMPLPFFVLHSVTVGDPRDPWGLYRLRLNAINGVGSSRDLAFRRVCLRLLARMAFLSAERALARGATHPFMALLETMHGPEYYGEMLPFEEVETRLLVHPANQSAFLQVLFLMMFVHRRFPWPSRQYLADVQYRESSRPLWAWGGVRLMNQTIRIVLAVPGVLQALVVDGNLWHVLAAHGLGSRVDASEHPLRFKIKRNLGHYYCLDVCFVSRMEEDKLVVVLRNTRLLSKWLCGDTGRHILREVCRQRRRRVVQAVAKGAPVAFAAAVPDLLTFVRGPSVRGKKERLLAWLESKLEKAKS